MEESSHRKILRQQGIIFSWSLRGIVITNSTDFVTGNSDPVKNLFPFLGTDTVFAAMCHTELDKIEFLKLVVKRSYVLAMANSGFYFCVFLVIARDTA